MLKRIVSAVCMMALALVIAPSAQAASGVWAKTGNNVGTVNVGWSNRGGSCHVAYTEAGQSADKYFTQASCDSGMIEVGHLTPGATYSFRVMEDGGTWSGRVTAVAAGAYRAQTTTQVAAAPVQNAPQHTETIAETLPEDDYPVEYYKTCNHQGSMMTDGRLNDDERATGKCGTGITNFRTVSGQASGDITLYWSDSMLGADNYHVVYGTESGHYTMGALNVGGASNSFTVHELT
ncbi:MAG TPA: hypothetical protein VF209_02910, partial [Patescibacteria group bacterium]